jgi:mannose-6-phosphate isomerase-like protein (cupin superfamily)
VILGNVIDALDTMYPCHANKVSNSTFECTPYSTAYGYILNGEAHFPNGNVAKEGQYFCFWIGKNSSIKITGETVIFTRLGFKGQNMVGGPIEESGRLVYIDSCSDSLLVYPPRLGDPSLSMLHFPAGVNQSFHIHPSIRLGVVAKGNGIAWTKTASNMHKNVELKEGMMFCIEERENHRFSTESESMTVIAFHPDGDWGPTDHNHTMLNRTYLTNK